MDFPAVPSVGEKFYVRLPLFEKGSPLFIFTLPEFQKLHFAGSKQPDTHEAGDEVTFFDFHSSNGSVKCKGKMLPGFPAFGRVKNVGSNSIRLSISNRTKLGFTFFKIRLVELLSQLLSGEPSNQQVEL